ncbi:histone-lysine N-methyltransferase SETMAR [Plakobranchus ocellatus]|uniref:Histone-lysine N-methyltransferase SETMAR n=1 Tax=Plakobranchus ocellatus TaxID=259542 RepID=A0AAV4DJW9_9GAST|nr:histone-lysine N-methyltransferase SETMAR [Plakobranchus ocellatus]
MMISVFQALRQATTPVEGPEPATEGSLQISGRIRYPSYHRRPDWLILHCEKPSSLTKNQRCIEMSQHISEIHRSWSWNKNEPDIYTYDNSKAR